LKLIEKKVAQQQVQIDLDLSHEVIEARIDRDRMKQVLLNLYLNALDAMPESGRLSVILSKGVDPATSGHDTVATMNREFLKIQVVDNGKGIEPIDLPNIFDPYFTTKNAGTGLGLAIAYNIIKAHEGKITAESNPGFGTTITVLLPVSKPYLRANHE
jgi:signal transduction histidine kinase